jgi:hypothetical protein
MLSSFRCLQITLIGFAASAVLLAACSGGSSQPPASLSEETATASAGAESSRGLEPIAGADISPATADLAGLVGEMNGAEVALVQALDGGSTAADLMELQKELASRALAVGRLADLLTDTAASQDDPTAQRTADMYENVAEVAYAVALDSGVTAPPDLLDSATAASVQTGLAHAWLSLSSGDGEQQQIVRDVLGDAYPGDVVEVEVDGDDLPDVAVSASQARDSFETDLGTVLSLVLPDSGTKAALNAAIDPNTTMSLEELAGVAAARLSLFAQPAPQASLAGNIQAQTLSFDVARRTVMSKPRELADNTQALRTFVTLADPKDFADFLAFRGRKQPDGKAVSDLIFEVAMDAFRERSDRPDLQFLADLLIYADRDKLVAKYPDLASKVQRVLFDAYVAGDEPVIDLASARYDAATNSIVLAISYSNPGQALTLICSGLDARRSVVQVPGGSGQLAVVMPNEANPREHSSTQYECRTKYGQAFNGEVSFVEQAVPTDTPEPEEPTPTPVRPPPAQPTPTECAHSGSAAGLFECES